jgi:hypothetical protein
MFSCIKTSRLPPFPNTWDYGTGKQGRRPKQPGRQRSKNTTSTIQCPKSQSLPAVFLAGSIRGFMLTRSIRTFTRLRRGLPACGGPHCLIFDQKVRVEGIPLPIFSLRLRPTDLETRQRSDMWPSREPYETSIFPSLTPEREFPKTGFFGPAVTVCRLARHGTSMLRRLKPPQTRSGARPKRQ